MQLSRRSSVDITALDAPSTVERDSYTSFDSTSLSESHLSLPLDGLHDPFGDDIIATHGPGQHREQRPLSDVLGQFSFAPATQTTVVTTTTTTTTSFPPLRMKAPNHLYELDPKLYPLAASPTPQSMKRLCFDMDGRPTVFREAENAHEALQELCQQQKSLQESQGVLRSVARFPTTQWATPKSLWRAITPADSAQNPASANRGVNSWQSTPPVSISEAAKLANKQPERRKISDLKPSTRIKYPSARQAENTRQGTASRLQICQTSTPITPSTGTQATNSEEIGASHRGRRSEHVPVRPTIGASEFDVEEQQQTLSPRPEVASDSPFNAADGFMDSDTPETRVFTRRSASYSSTPLEIGHVRSDSALDETTASFARPRPAVLDTTAAQDISLPSPSLSPVTAAANLQNRMGYFDDATTSTSNHRPTLSSPPHDPSEDEHLLFQTSSMSKLWEAPGSVYDNETDISAKPPPIPSLMEIPIMLDFFEAMPTDMKSYYMYQLLRRCPKPLLHFVADVVNPALKCDFLNLLPLELCQTVIGHLDVKSLCRAAQVSKKWRQIIDSDEKTWKKLLDKDGYVLPEGELQRAIWEGWGWQHGSGPEGWEMNIGDSEKIRSGKWPIPAASLGVTITTVTKVPPQNANCKRTKRKAAPKSRAASRKQRRKKETSSDAVAHFDSEALMKHISMADGPYAAAQAAAIAVPIAQIGLPSLRNLHLYKSLYRRHRQINSSWMRDDIKPRHLAFKAHQRHVVTCLQFDTDKILTGSDDTNINVYDTQTGALRATLEGHEGGVWALQYQGNTLVSGSTDRSVRVWDIEKGVCTHVFQGHTSTVRCLIILMPTEVGKTVDGKPIMMPKEPLIITGSRDSNLRVWKLPKPEDPSSIQRGQSSDDSECSYFVRALTGHTLSVRAIAAHGDTLVSGSYDCNVRVWKISTGETLHRLEGHSQKVYSVVLDHERNRCISGSMDNLVKVWSLETGTVLFNLEGHASLVGLLDLQRNRLVSAAADSTLRIWDPENGHCKSTLSAHTGAITCFQHDGHKVISGSDRTLKMWDVKTGEFARDLLTDLSGVWQVKFDERRCVAAVQRNQLTYIEVLDFGASRDGVLAVKRGRRIPVNSEGVEISDPRDATAELDMEGVE